MHITALAALTSHQSNFSLQPRLRQKRDVDSWPLFCRKHLACSASNARFANFYTNALRATYSKDLWQIRKLNLIYHDLATKTNGNIGSFSLKTKSTAGEGYQPMASLLQQAPGCQQSQFGAIDERLRHHLQQQHVGPSNTSSTSVKLLVLPSRLGSSRIAPPAAQTVPAILTQ
ncbi:hypothetical protein HBI81_241780 [Parastagonospora nodorum]|nr:hypothetical protein HBH53_147580 [Parastagonospora nodorum]KAH3966976.1 hypothetical protein HBH51_138980 [Parastagonospora nodorum]KAH4050847.1 hypothetical protein HBH49_124020 [Parastagonospora nodorum]KAH4070179.1 hypothetical protein HBH50_095110 [Parastagonospora nodorum]KAH4088601.1 hypothetical protein HBH46_196330 [Parastagonospora nodorum]